MLIDLRPKDEVCLRLNAQDVRVSRFMALIDKNRIAIEQTDPAVDEHLLETLIFFTYHPRHADTERLGFQARIEQLMPDQSVILKRLTRPFACDLRLWPRVRVSVMPELRAWRQTEEIQVVDISAGGTHLILNEDDGDVPQAQTLVQIQFAFEKGETLADGNVLRSWIDSAGLRHVEVQFLGEPEIRDRIYSAS